MKISTKGRYALRMMLDIAEQGEGAVVSLKEISQRQDISVKYQEQIVMQLSRSGFLTSVRGPSGGYRLARNPKDYRIGEILRAIEGNLAPIARIEEENSHCGQCGNCQTLPFWQGLDTVINDYVDRFTLFDLMEHPHDCCAGGNTAGQTET